MSKKAVLVLSIILGISVLINILFFFTTAFIDIEWENEYNNLDTSWCERHNDYTDGMNLLITELRLYDSSYENIILFENLDCWS